MIHIILDGRLENTGSSRRDRNAANSTHRLTLLSTLRRRGRNKQRRRLSLISGSCIADAAIALFFIAYLLLRLRRSRVAVGDEIGGDWIEQLSETPRFSLRLRLFVRLLASISAAKALGGPHFALFPGFVRDLFGGDFLLLFRILFRVGRGETEAGRVEARLILLM